MSVMANAFTVLSHAVVTANICRCQLNVERYVSAQMTMLYLVAKMIVSIQIYPVMPLVIKAILRSVGASVYQIMGLATSGMQN
jgi:type IV secretory pathway TraG/TraD family ATPase VirD4